MKICVRAVMKAGLYLWQLPQHLLGLTAVLCLKGRLCRRYHTARVYCVRLPIGVSLGDYIIVYRGAEAQRVIAHEWGHSRQSRLLGPFYLPVVGVPSLLMNLLSEAGILRKDRYFLRWPENWADRLGGVDP